MAELTATRAALRALADRAATTDPAACGADDICTILTPVLPVRSRGHSQHVRSHTTHLHPS
ncbi:hypothetical protein [Streptomyces sp. NPDC017230]|uniref:hypothetical protein n=1 Tax=unclassified Streptomyces TaxID=2593676 RepID=UPI003795A76E